MGNTKIGQLLSLVTVVILLGFTLVACSSNGVPEADTGNDTEGSASNENGLETEENEGQDQYGGTLRIVYGGAVTELGYPPNVRSTYDSVTALTVYETLAKFNEAGEAIPWLAEGWEKDPDQNTITVELKQGIQFHDGTDFNAEAVKWNIEAFRDAGRVEAAAIDTVEVLDEHRLQINLSSWDHSIQDNLFGFMGIASPTAYEEKGEEWLRDNPVGTGPFIFDEWIKDEKVSFVRNDNYWIDGKPYLDGIEFQTISETATAEAAMAAGDFDLYMFISPRVANNLQADFEIEMLENAFGAVGYSLSPDSENADSPLADVNVRKAIAHAIDKQAIVDTVFYGYGEAVDQYAVEASSTFSPDVEGTPFDPEKAKELLAEAGYADGFETTLTYVETPDLTQMHTAIQAYLADVGIDVTLNPVQNPQWREMTASEGSWDGLMYTTFRISNDVIFDFNRSMAADSSHYRDTHLSDEAEDLLAQAREVKSSEEYMAITHELQKIIFGDHQTVIPIMVNGQLLAQTGKVHDHGLMKTQLTSWTPESAWVEQ